MRKTFVATAENGRAITLVAEVEVAECEFADMTRRRVPTMIRVETDDGWPVQRVKECVFIVANPLGDDFTVNSTALEQWADKVVPPVSE